MVKELNKNWELRNKIIGKTDKDIFYWFEIGHATLTLLIEHNFVDLSQCQNNSPSIEELYNFGENYESKITYEGYAVNSSRSDYRVSVEGFNIGPIGNDQAIELFQEFHGADEVDYDKETKIFRAWWD